MDLFAVFEKYAEYIAIFAVIIGGIYSISNKEYRFREMLILILIGIALSVSAIPYLGKYFSTQKGMLPLPLLIISLNSRLIIGYITKMVDRVFGTLLDEIGEKIDKLFNSKSDKNEHSS